MTCPEILELCREFLTDSSVSIYENSYEIVGNTWLVMANIDGNDVLIAVGENDTIYKELTGNQYNKIKVCQLSHENRLIINKYLSYTVPVAFGRNVPTFGLGDRLGNANYAHLQALKDSGIKPVLAQQSMRELKLTGRSYDDVLDTASWAVFKSGWQEGFAADGDHLKYEKDIAKALECGYTMITLDCSDMLADAPDNHDDLVKTYSTISSETRQRIEKEYFNNQNAKSLGVEFNKINLMKIAVTYLSAVEYTIKIYNNYILKAGRAVDFELSLDETGYVTDPAAHYFVANELEKSNVFITSLAPRFVGEFEKGIDYIGNLDEFADDLHNHARIAKHFGYKLSIHSGSDKFSIYKFIKPETDGRFHVKTSGTSWLEAVRVIAEKEPVLYRDMHNCALVHFQEAKKNYQVSAELNRVKPLKTMKDQDLGEYLSKQDSRQLMHITYGFILEDKDLKTRIYKALNTHRDSYEEAVRYHIGKHICLLK